MSLYKNVTVEAEQGRPDSLTRPVRIAFTITPNETKAPSHHYSPVAVRVTSVGSNSKLSVGIGWYPMIYPSHGAVRGKRFIGTKFSRSASPGHTITLTSVWGTASRNNSDTQNSSVVFINESGLTQDIMLEHTLKAVVYHSVRSGNSITVPSSWKLQAYIVDDSVTDGTILEPEDLQRPVLPTPILWNSLPEESTWMLTENRNGMIRICNDQYGPAETEVETVVETTSKKDPLSEILERLGVIEKSIDRIGGDVAAGQKAIDDLQHKFSILEKAASTKDDVKEVRSSIAGVEVKTAALAGSFGQNQDRLTVMHKAVTETQRLLSEMEKSTGDRISTLEETTGQAQDRVGVVERAIQQTQGHVYLVQQMVLAKQSPEAITPEPASPLNTQPSDQSTRILAVEGRVDKLEKLVQEQRKALRGVDRRTTVVEKLETDLAVVQASVAALTRRVGAVEGGLGDDEAGTGGLPSSPSIGGSPVMFPSHLPKNSPAD